MGAPGTLTSVGHATLNLGDLAAKRACVHERTKDHHQIPFPATGTPPLQLLLIARTLSLVLSEILHLIGNGPRHRKES